MPFAGFPEFNLSFVIWDVSSTCSPKFLKQKHGENQVDASAKSKDHLRHPHLGIIPLSAHTYKVVLVSIRHLLQFNQWRFKHPFHIRRNIQGHGRSQKSWFVGCAGATVPTKVKTVLYIPSQFTCFKHVSWRHAEPFKTFVWLVKNRCQKLRMDHAVATWGFYFPRVVGHLLAKKRKSWTAAT